MISLIHNFSASQYEAYVNTCKRYWKLRWIDRIPVPSQPYQDFGTGTHKAIEKRTDAGIITPDTPEIYIPFVKAIEHHLPPLDELDVCTELRADMPTHLGKPWKIVIDLLRPSLRPIVLRDWKTTSDFRYAKTPDELRRDIQLNSYAEYVFQVLEEHDEDHGGVIDAGLVYIKTEKKKKDKDGNEIKTKSKKLPKVLPVIVELHRETVKAVWDSTRPILDQMVETASMDFDQIEPTTTSCDKYPPHGCPFRAKCGLEPRAPGFGKKKETNVPSFLDKLKNKAKQQEESQTKPSNGTSADGTKITAGGQTYTVPPDHPLAKESAEKAADKSATTADDKPADKADKGKSGFLARARGQVPKGPEPSGGPGPTIIPPDAPARDSSAPLQAGDPGHKASEVGDGEAELAAQDDANVEAEAASGKKKPGRPKGSKNEVKSNGRRSFTLFIDVIQVKGVGDVEPTSLEDWFGPIDMELNDHVKAESNLPSWWLLPFAEQKAALSIAVQEKIAKGLPPAMMVSSSSSITRDILPMLLPHATDVFRALRG